MAVEIPQLDQNSYEIIKKIATFFVIILLTFVTRSILLYIIDKKIALLNIKKPGVLRIITNTIKYPLSYLILIQGLYIALIYIGIPYYIWQFETYSIINGIYILSISFVILYFSFKIIDVIGVFIERRIRYTDSYIDEQLVPLIIKSIRIIVVTIGILTILSNFGYNITSLIAGLGLGGLAFALAAQTTISNLFGSATIFSDKPFRIGDLVQIGEINGIVEDVGFRTTHIRRSDHALVIVPNSKFVNNEIINYSAMKKRKIEFFLRLAYETYTYKIKIIAFGIKKIIEDDDRFDHSSHIVRFTDIGESSLNIYVFCTTDTTDFAKFQEIKEELNLKIMSLLEELDIKMSSQVYVKTESH